MRRHPTKPRTLCFLVYKNTTNVYTLYQHLQPSLFHQRQWECFLLTYLKEMLHEIGEKEGFQKLLNIIRFQMKKHR